MQMIIQGAPVLKNVRMACVFAIPAGTERVIRSLLYKTNVKLATLCRGAGRDIVLLYREGWMEGWIGQPQVAAFLQQYGYYGGSLKQYLQHLGERISYFYHKSQGFPHEMGVFLGYPLADVQGFISHQGKNYRCIGYWKVYSDVEGARRTFRLFDEARSCAVDEFFSGKSVREIAC